MIMTKCMTRLISFRPSKMLCALQLLLVLQLTTCVLGTSESLRFSPNVPELRLVAGDTAVLSCLVRRAAPGSFTWTGPAVSNSRTSIVHYESGVVSELTIVGFTQQDAGDYSCSFTGAGTISIPLKVISEPGFLTVQTHQRFVEGTDVVVECPAIFGNPPASMYWSRDNRPIQNSTRFSAENGRLRIQNIHMEDMRDNYVCDLQLNDGNTYPKTIKVEVVPRNELAPRINDVNRRTEVAYGDPLDLPCILEEQKDDVTFSWTINTEFEHDHQVNTRANLHRQAHEFLGGIYTCRAENEYGFDVVNFVVKVVGPPLPRTCSLVKKALALGITVVLKYCDLTSAVELSDLSFKWQRVDTNGQLVNVSPEGRFSMNHDGWLTIENLKASDLGEYQVTISSENGSAVHTVQLEQEREATTSPLSAVTQAQALGDHSQSPLVSLNLKFEIQSEVYSCTNIKEEVKNFIQKELVEQYDFSGVVFEEAVVNCPFDSKFGTFKASLSGRNTKQLVTQIKMGGLPALTLKNGLTVALSFCKNECLPLKSVAPKSLSDLSGGIIAAVFICVVLAGLVLLIVILVRYRRRSLSKYTDEEQVLPLHLSGTGQPTYKTNPDIFHPKLSKKPVYSRSISLTFPISR